MQQQSSVVSRSFTLGTTTNQAMNNNHRDASTSSYASAREPQNNQAAAANLHNTSSTPTTSAAAALAHQRIHNRDGHGHGHGHGDGDSESPEQAAGGIVRSPVEDETTFYELHVADYVEDDDTFFYTAKATAVAAELQRSEATACKLEQDASTASPNKATVNSFGESPDSNSLRMHRLNDSMDSIAYDDDDDDDDDQDDFYEGLSNQHGGGGAFTFASTSSVSNDDAAEAFGGGGGATVLGWAANATGPGSPRSPGVESPSATTDAVMARAEAVQQNADLLREYEIIDLRVIHRRGHTGFEEEKEFPIEMHSVIAGRYHILEFLGSAAFSRAVQAIDLQTGRHVCVKIIRNNKDLNDQSLDEVKILRYVNRMDPMDTKGVLRLYDFFYFKEHLFIVTELLRANLYEFQKYNREIGEEPYFTMPRIQSIARQVLTSLDFLHGLGLIHNDLKPENILIQSYSRCVVKVIDLGSSCFTTDHLSSYVQSRSYRAPEVILGHFPYDQRIDIWSLGLILAELYSGRIVLQNHSLASLLARLVSIFGPLPESLLKKSKFTHRYYTRDLQTIFERDERTKRTCVLTPVPTTLRSRMVDDAHPMARSAGLPPLDDDFVDFLKFLLQLHPEDRPTASQALAHPWLRKEYA
ncbi:protein tyrosine kinase [Pycnococcus provasolii]